MVLSGPPIHSLRLPNCWKAMAIALTTLRANVMSDKLSIASTIREAGRVSIGNSKMPGSTFAVTVDKCNVGGKLATVKGSTCHKCYAVVIEKRYPDVHKGWTNNYARATALIATDPL